jgi:hypothetical protein
VTEAAATPVHSKAPWASQLQLHPAQVRQLQLNPAQATQVKALVAAAQSRRTLIAQQRRNSEGAVERPERWKLERIGSGASSCALVGRAPRQLLEIRKTPESRVRPVPSLPAATIESRVACA